MSPLTAPYRSPPLLLALMSPFPKLRRHLPSLAAAAAPPLWIAAPLARLSPASADASLFHVALDVSAAPDLISSHTAAGQYLRLRAPGTNPAFMAIASPPRLAAERGVFEFLVKRVPGSTAEVICGMREGGVVEVGEVMGRGFEVDRISPPERFGTVLIFATGSGISPIRSLVESGFGAHKRSDVRLYYGARSLQRMAYQDRFKEWESTGVRVLPVLSQPDDSWKGERGYVQSAFSRAKQLFSSSSTAAVLCGHKQMTEEITSVLVADGVSKEKILRNF